MKIALGTPLRAIFFCSIVETIENNFDIPDITVILGKNFTGMKKLKSFAIQAAWYLTLIAIGGTLVAIEVTGIAPVFGFWVAIGVVVSMELIFGISSKLASKTESLKLKFFSYGMWGVLSLALGMSLMQHMKHSGQERTAKVGAEAEVAATKLQLSFAKAEVATLAKGVEEVAEAIGVHKGALNVAAVLSDETVNEITAGLAILHSAQARMKAEEASGRGKQWSLAKGDYDQAERQYGNPAVLQDKLDGHKSAMNERSMLTQGATGKESLLASKQERLAKAEQVVETLTATMLAQSAKSAVQNDGMYFIYALSTRFAKGDTAISDAILVGMFAIVGFLAQGAFGQMCRIDLLSILKTEMKQAANVVLELEPVRIEVEGGKSGDVEPTNVVCITSGEPRESTSMPKKNKRDQRAQKDDKKRQIVKLLKENPIMSEEELALALGVTRTSVQTYKREILAERRTQQARRAPARERQCA